VNGVKYLRQKVEFLKNCQDRKYSSEEILMGAGWKFEVIKKTLQEEDNQRGYSKGARGIYMCMAH